MRCRTGLSILAVVVSVAAWAGCVPSSLTRYDVARNLHNEKEFGDAIEEYEIFIAENKKNALVPDALYNIAWCHRSMDERALALLAYQKLIDQYPGTNAAERGKVEMAGLRAEKPAPPPKDSGPK